MEFRGEKVRVAAGVSRIQPFNRFRNESWRRAKISSTLTRDKVSEVCLRHGIDARCTYAYPLHWPGSGHPIASAERHARVTLTVNLYFPQLLCSGDLYGLHARYICSCRFSALVRSGFALESLLNGYKLNCLIKYKNDITHNESSMALKLDGTYKQLINNINPRLKNI